MISFTPNHLIIRKLYELRFFYMTNVEATFHRVDTSNRSPRQRHPAINLANVPSAQYICNESEGAPSDFVQIFATEK